MCSTPPGNQRSSVAVLFDWSEFMAISNPRKIFVNLPVRDLEKSMEFFASLGFTFNPQFTDGKAACMVFSDDGYAMLLSTPFFQTFTTRELCNTSRATEALFAL